MCHGEVEILMRHEMLALQSVHCISPAVLAKECGKSQTNCHSNADNARTGKY